MASDKTESFQDQAREMLRAQQDAFVAAVKAWRESVAKRHAAAGVAQAPAARHAAEPRRSGRGSYAFAAKLLADQSRFMEELSKAMGNPRRRASPARARRARGYAESQRRANGGTCMPETSLKPWLDLYRGVPPTIAPETETALDMFRATAARDRERAARPLLRSLDHGRRSSTRCPMRLPSRCSGAASSPAIASRCTCRTSRRC